MRKILFRGKANSKNPKYAYYNSWIYGDLMTNRDIMFIHPKVNIFRIEHYLAKMVVSHRVDPETVGQFTGLTDKNGIKIFEGDIVKFYDNLNKLEFGGIVGFKNGSFVITNDYITHYRWADYEVEIIGNIHDSPELLEVKQ